MSCRPAMQAAICTSGGLSRPTMTCRPTSSYGSIRTGRSISPLPQRQASAIRYSACCPLETQAEMCMREASSCSTSPHPSADLCASLPLEPSSAEEVLTKSAPVARFRSRPHPKTAQASKKDNGRLGTSLATHHHLSEEISRVGTNCTDQTGCAEDRVSLRRHFVHSVCRRWTQQIL